MPREEGWVDFDAPLIEILALVAGRTNEGKPVGILTARLAPKDCSWPTNFLVTQSQLVRLRDDIDMLLNDPRSWLYLPEDEQQTMGSVHPDDTG